MSTNVNPVTTRPSHAEDPKELLNTKLDQLRARREKRSRLYKLNLAVGGAFLALSPIVYFIVQQQKGSQIALAACGESWVFDR
jgi:hypothetical protein